MVFSQFKSPLRRTTARAVRAVGSRGFRVSLQGRSEINLPCTQPTRETTAPATGDECAVTPCNRTDLPCTTIPG